MTRRPTSDYYSNFFQSPRFGRLSRLVTETANAAAARAEPITQQSLTRAVDGLSVPSPVPAAPAPPAATASATSDFNYTGPGESESTLPVILPSAFATAAGGGSGGVAADGYTLPPAAQITQTPAPKPLVAAPPREAPRKKRFYDNISKTDIAVGASIAGLGIVAAIRSRV